MTSCTELMQRILPAAHEISLRTPRRLNSRIASRAEKLTGQINADDPVPLVKRHLVNRRICLKAGVVDQDVKAAEFLEYPLEQFPDLIFSGHVRLVSVGPTAAAAGLLNH